MGDINTIISVLILNENGLRLSGGIKNKNVKRSQETCLYHTGKDRPKVNGRETIYHANIK